MVLLSALCTMVDDVNKLKEIDEVIALELKNKAFVRTWKLQQIKAFLSYIRICLKYSWFILKTYLHRPNL